MTDLEPYSTRSTNSLADLTLLPDTYINRNYKIIGKLGQGSFGRVYEIESKTDPQQRYAVKYLAGEHFTDESLILSGLKHENIVTMVHAIKDHYTDPATNRTINIGFIIMEKCLYDLDAYVKRSMFVTPAIEKTVMQQVLCGIRYLHARQIVHRDLKPGNVLIQRDMRVKLADFGTSTVIGWEMEYSGLVGTFGYQAPEILLGTNGYTKAIDLWSAGCVFLTMLLKKEPFECTYTFELRSLIARFCAERRRGIVERFDRCVKREFRRGTFACVPLWPATIYQSMSRFSKAYRNEPVAVKQFIDELQANGRDDTLLFDLLSRLMEIEPCSRITADAALDHGFFRDY